MPANTPIDLLLIALFACLCTVEAHTAEYFVSKQGDDTNDGRRPENAFLTIQRGVAALAPGDTLTVGPGEYRETVVRKDLGDETARTTIRAEIPGTAVLRGDVAAPAFRKLEGYRYVYAADFPQPVQAVNEVDTLSVL